MDVEREITGPQGIVGFNGGFINTPNSTAPDVSVVGLDLADFASIENCAALVLREESSIDLLVLNAGVCGASGTTKQGFEMQMGKAT